MSKPYLTLYLVNINQELGSRLLLCKEVRKDGETYFQSKLNPEIDPACRLCLQANETLHHL